MKEVLSEYRFVDSWPIHSYSVSAAVDELPFQEW